jgi:Tfp pilus assembly protein PilF
MTSMNDDAAASDQDARAGSGSVDSPVEAPEEGAPSGITQEDTTAHGAPAPAPAQTPRSDLDKWLNRAIGATVVVLVLFAAYFGYSYYLAQKQARLSNPALQVVDQVQKLVDAKPNDASLRARLGEALAAAGDTNNAKAQLIAAVKIDPKFAGAYQDLAQIALVEKDNANAEVYLKRLLDLTSTGDYQGVNERREFALFNLGELTLSQKRWLDAIGYLNEAIRIRKDASDSYLRLGQAYLGSGDASTAMDNVNIALKFDPKYPEAHYFRGTLYVAKGDKVDAAWDFRAALDGAPDNAQAQSALAALGTFDSWMQQAQGAFTDGDLPVAVNAVSIARSIEPTSYEAAMLHGRILVQQGEYSGAVDAFTIALKIRPSDPAAASALKSATASSKKGAK